MGKYKVRHLKLLIPKAFNIVLILWQVFWLSPIDCGLPIRQPADSGESCIQHERITAAGTAPDLHRIPFSSPKRTNSLQK